MTLKDAALAYARHGWHVFPIAPRSKRPPLTTHGLKDASTDLGQVEKWWTQHPEANIGIATEPSGLAVVDVDGPGEGLAGELPPTAEVETRPGRRQLLYTGKVRSGVKNLASDVDTRGRGGYIVAPPSIHPDTGQPYRWVSKQRPAPLPEWIPEFLARRERPAVAMKAGRTTRYGRSALDALQAAVLRAANGERNNTLFKSAVRTFELVKGGEVDGQPATDGLRRAAQAAGLEHAEVERTLESAWQKAEASQPSRVNARRALDPRLRGYEALDVPALRKLPAPKWLIPDVLPEGLTLLIGRYGSLKTWAALDWAAAVAEDGHRVLYFVGEDVHGFGKRVVDLSEGRGIGLENLRIVPDVPKLLRPGEPERLHKTIADWEARLIVIDTWARALPGVGENDNADLSQAIDLLGALMTEHRCSSLVVAHTGFQDTRMRGHTSVEDAADCVWHAKKDESIVGAATIKNPKIKNAPLQHPLEVSLRKKGDGVILSPSVMDVVDEL